MEVSRLRSFSFGPEHRNVGEIYSHYSVVMVEKAKDGWWGVVTAKNAHESLNENIWKETVQFVVKQMAVTNRSNVVFDHPSSRRKPTTSP